MKYRLSQFVDFCRTPFPYLTLALCIFMAWTLLSNSAFMNALQGHQPDLPAADSYKLCLVCSGPGARDAISDIGFTAANFVLFPVTAVSIRAMALLEEISAGGRVAAFTVYLALTAVYGVFLPFFIFMGYELLADRLPGRTGVPSVYTG